MTQSYFQAESDYANFTQSGTCERSGNKARLFGGRGRRAAVVALPLLCAICLPSRKEPGENVKFRVITLTTAVLTLAVVAGLQTAGPGFAADKPLVQRVQVGAYIHLAGRPFQDPVAPADLAAMESQIGKLDVVHYFFTWGRKFSEALNSNANGRTIMLSMKPDGNLVSQIRNGGQDAYIDQFATDAKAFGKTIYLRFGHEMNGEWMSYSAGAAGGPSADDFKAAWRRLVDRVRRQGASNVKFVWSPNETDNPARAGNRMEDYWPGDGYVDVAGFDGYNWTNAQPQRGDGSNRSFEQVVQGPYDRISKFTTRPIWICEVGTTEPNKAAWITDMFASTKFPQLTGIIYFSENDQRDVQRDWRIDSSSAATAAWKSAMNGRGTPGTTTPGPTSSLPKPPVDQVVSLPAISQAQPFSPEIVKGAQALLNSRGVATANDGTFSAAMTTAVRNFQQLKAIPVTGVINAVTWTRLIYG